MGSRPDLSSREGMPSASSSYVYQRQKNPSKDVEQSVDMRISSVRGYVFQLRLDYSKTTAFIADPKIQSGGVRTRNAVV